MSGKPFPKRDNSWYPEFKRANRRRRKRLQQWRREHRRAIGPVGRFVDDRITAEIDRRLLTGSGTGRPQGIPFDSPED